MEFKPYPKIHRLGKEETEGILDVPVIIQEKVDGANASIWWDSEKKEVRCGSRNQEKHEGFNGFVDWAKNDPKLREFFSLHPDYRLYGEWLVKHTISYPTEAYRKFYLFDIRTPSHWLSQEVVEDVARGLGVPYPYVFGLLHKPTEEAIKEFVGKSKIGPVGEGVVIKPLSPWFNKFGDFTYAKMVHESFKESNALVFGGNNKTAENYWELYIVNKYMTAGRVKKIMQKWESQNDERLDFKHTPMISGLCYHDMVQEECWDFFKKVPKINVTMLKTLATKKAVLLFHAYLRGEDDAAG